MFFVTKHFDICAAHQLHLPYESPCNTMHGHNYQCSITVASKNLDPYGIIVDFTQLKRLVHARLDHKTINDVIPNMHPTAENLCEWIAQEVQDFLNSEENNVPPGSLVHCVVLKETDGNEVKYFPSGQ